MIQAVTGYQVLGGLDYRPASVFKLSRAGRTWLAKFEDSLPEDWLPRPQRLLRDGVYEQ